VNITTTTSAMKALCVIVLALIFDGIIGGDPPSEFCEDKPNSPLCKENKSDRRRRSTDDEEKFCVENPNSPKCKSDRRRRSTDDKEKFCVENPNSPKCKNDRKRRSADGANSCPDEDEGFCRKGNSLTDEYETKVMTTKLDGSVVFLHYSCNGATSEAGVEGYDCIKVGEAKEGAVWDVDAECTRKVVGNIVESRCVCRLTGEVGLCRRKESVGWFCHAEGRQGMSLSKADFYAQMEAALAAEELAKRWESCPKVEGSKAKNEKCLCEGLTEKSWQMCVRKARGGWGICNNANGVCP